ncbi:hypothetical protein NM688_g6615 [Phlebia brevispora]|uniref:Uncharacterized protein n=1 Tax=Phlebia brevispora TaxID=194682 RepID=A0ACC1SE51_9APHY|nr:hypothetical protein NM688_g6615 [Phlebia brevispora]
MFDTDLFEDEWGIDVPMFDAEDIHYSQENQDPAYADDRGSEDFEETDSEEADEEDETRIDISSAQSLRVVELMHEAITEGLPTTKRDIYYKDVHLFGAQATVDKLVDDIAATIGVDRADLHVRASSKGLFCGAGLTIYMRQGDAIHGSANESTLIPPAEDIRRFDVNDSLCWILVVEKEAVFQTLCHTGFSEHLSLPGRGLIITGKGYPDVATRQLVCALSENLPESFAISYSGSVDGDPYGIDILSVYKRGSSKMMHQQDVLTAPRIKWIGIMASELNGLGIDKDALLPITKHDEKKALSMLRKAKLPRKWRQVAESYQRCNIATMTKELQHMLFNRRKAEIEILFAGKEVAGAESYSVTRGFSMFSDLDEDATASMQPENVLTKYLIVKITSAVNRCRP